MAHSKGKSKPLVFNLWGDENLSTTITEGIDGRPGQLSHRTFPDGECYLRIFSDVENREIVLITSMDHPNAKLLSILFAVKTLKNLGARRVGLVTPYLPYMRQDKSFAPGEAVTSKHFSAILMADFDWVGFRWWHFFTVYISRFLREILHAEGSCVF
jgi:ribose-phosphate pyrophosphokinase